ncbi:MAG: hypothetical protein IKK95_04265 [Lachnospiraceae bacterium]|nr:hypothetical protein [Lachnospiraceae bacterium]
MKEKQNKRLGLKLISLLGAFLVWLWVVNVADPVMTDTVEIPVEIENGHVLTENGLTYEIVGKKTTTVSYEVHTTNAYRIRSSDFRAYADMTELWSVTGAVPVKVEVLNNASYLVSSPVSKTTAIKIETEPLQTKRFELNTILNGELEEGFQIGEIKLSPDHIYLEGPESQIGQISSAGIEFSIDGLNSEVSGVAIPRFYDANGNRMDLSNRITKNCDSVDYTMEVLKVKELPLDFEVSGEVTDGYRFTGVKCDVKSVPVVGLKSALASLNILVIPGDILKIDGASTDVVKTVDISKILPNGVTLAGSDRKEINVTMTVERLEDEVYLVELDSGCFVGENDEYFYRAEPNRVSVRVRALREELDSLTLDADDLEINVSELTEGVHVVDVGVATELDPAYEIITVGTCSVNVTKISDGPGAESTAATDETTKAED